MIRGKYLTSKDDIAPVLAVRNAVFVEEQGFSAEGERDAYDDMAIYALAFNEEGAPVSTGRLFVWTGTASSPLAAYAPCAPTAARAMAI